MHVLPPESIQGFRGFAQGALEDLLLRESDSHLSYGATEKDSRSIRGYGATSAKDGYMELPAGVLHIIDKASFGLFCTGLSRLIVSRPLLGALVERLWDTTNSFYFSTAGEMTMTPYDFSMLTGIGVGGHSIPYDTDIGKWEAAWIYLLGTRPPHFRLGMVVRYMYILSPLYVYSLYTVHTFCTHSAFCICTRTFHTLYIVYSLLPLPLQLWVYAYFSTLGPESEVEMPSIVSYSHRYDSRYLRRTRETFLFFRRYFNIMTAIEITW
ncbi:hypothetical protein ACSBR1_031465 [Camellia fascicularis]